MNEGTLERVANIVGRWTGNIERVEVLTFYDLGADKRAKIGMSYELADVTPPTEVEAAREVFPSRGLTVFCPSLPSGVCPGHCCGTLRRKIS